jgi:hypothetical protein
MKIKKMIRNIIGDTITGGIDYYRFPHLKQEDTTFTSQKKRKQIFEELIQKIKFEMIIETGTFRGTTLEYFHDVSGLPCISIEKNKRYFGYSFIRFFLNNNVKIYNNDSRYIINKLTQHKSLTQVKTLFYLDAHWNSDLPLFEELELILSNWKNYIIFIDDFEVPMDAGYGFDNYGKGKKLSLEYLLGLPLDDVSLFFPNIDSQIETGRRKGYIIICNDELANMLYSLKNIIKYNFT